jgi:endonuclease YncB( thermonuclease family)
MTEAAEAADRHNGVVRWINGDTVRVDGGSKL